MVLTDIFFVDVCGDQSSRVMLLRCLSGPRFARRGVVFTENPCAKCKRFACPSDFGRVFFYCGRVDEVRIPLWRSRALLEHRREETKRMLLQLLGSGRGPPNIL